MSSSESVSVDDFLERVQRSSATFAERATILSETIERVAAALIGMPGKTPNYVKDEDRKVGVAFDKLPTWNLWVADNDSDEDFGERVYEPLANVSIPRKSRAFPLLQKLLAAIESDLKDQTAEIDAAIGSLGRQPEKSGATNAKKPASGRPPSGPARQPQ